MSQHEAAAIGQWGKEVRVRVDELEAMIGQLELAQQRSRRLRRVRKRRDPESRIELAGNGSAPHDGLPLEDDRFDALARQYRCRRQAVVPSADEDDVGHLRISMAAFRPGAPMMPPPG